MEKLNQRGAFFSLSFFFVLLKTKNFFSFASQYTR